MFEEKAASDSLWGSEYRKRNSNDADRPPRVIMKARRVIPILPDPMSRLAPAVVATIKQSIAANLSRPGALLPILHGIQDALGYVPKDSVALIAHELNLSRAEVHGVITFYHHFRQEQPGRHIVQLCRAEACQAVGSTVLEVHITAKLGVSMKGTAADRRVTLEPVYCLGNCALAPSVTIDGRLFGRMTAQRFDELMTLAGAPA